MRLRQGVRQPDEVAATVPLRHLQLIDFVRRCEREAEHLGEPQRGHGAEHGTAVPNSAVQLSRHRWHRQLKPDAVVADVSANLLNNVVGVDQVAPPARRLERQGVAQCGNRDAAGREEANRLLLAHIGAQHCRNQPGSQRHLVRSLSGTDDGLSRHRSPTELGKQVGGALGRRVRELLVDAALEALRRLRATVPAECPRHRTWREVRRLEHDGGGRLDTSGSLAAHDTRHADRARVVGDEQVLGVERAVLTVQRAQPLSLGCQPDADGAAQLVLVVGVQRLAEFEHHVVRDVDRQGERADA